MTQGSTLINSLLDHQQSVYNGTAWHGPTLRGALRGITADEAVQIQTSSGHTIAEIALHCAYWKYSVQRRLEKNKRGSFGRKGSNWFKLSQPLTEAEWRSILELLDSEHKHLCEAIQAFPEGQLKKVPPGSKFSYCQLIQGIAAHDVFHAGQIRLLKKKRR